LLNKKAHPPLVASWNALLIDGFAHPTLFDLSGSLSLLFALTIYSLPIKRRFRKVPQPPPGDAKPAVGPCLEYPRESRVGKGSSLRLVADEKPDRAEP
jgi:hypothetical protein